MGGKQIPEARCADKASVVPPSVRPRPEMWTRPGPGESAQDGATRPLHHHPFLSSGNEVLRGMEAGQTTLGRAGARASLHWPDGPAWLDPSSISATLVGCLIDG